MKERLARRLRRLGREGPGWGLFTALCCVLAGAFFAEFVFQPGRILFGTDMLDQAFQLRKFAVEEVQGGRGLPLWNPFVYSGVPYVGILPGPVFYPTSLLYLVLPLGRAIGWTFVVHMAAAGSLSYAAGRAFGLRRWAAAASGLAFMLAGYMVSTLYGGHDGRMFAMALIPGVFACAEKGLETEEWRWFLGMGLVVALQIFTPHVQVMYFSSLAVSLYVAYRLALAWRDGEPGAAVVRTAGWFCAGFLVAALAGAVQILPAVDLLGHAVRGGTGQGGYEFAASWALPPQELTAFFLPDVVGSLPGSYWGTNAFKLHTEYLGAGALALALVAVLRPRGDRRVWFLAGASALGVLFSLGGATPVHRIAYEVVPLVGRFRAPAMMLGPVSFFVALLAGFGVQRVLDARGGGEAEEEDGGAGRADERRGGAGGSGADGGVPGPARDLPWRWLWAASAPFLLLALWAALSPEGLLRWVREAWFPAGWPRTPPQALASALRTTGLVALATWTAALSAAWGVARRRLPVWALAAVLALLVADLWRVDARYLETVDPERAFAGGPAVERLEERLAPGERVWPLEDTFGPNELMYWRIPSVTGSQNFRLAWYDRLVGGVSMEGLLRRPQLWPLADLAYLTVQSPVESPLLQADGSFRGVRLYRVAAELPHAFFPRTVVTAPDLDAALEETRALRDPGGRMVVEPATAEGAPAGAPGAGRGTARVAEWGGDEVVLEVEAEEGGLLFLSEVYHPAWRAYVDGEERPVYRANAAFRAVEVPAGPHRVRFVYRSTPFRAGAALSLAAAGAVLLALVSGLRGTRGRE